MGKNNVIVCHECSTENNLGSNYCEGCGTKLEISRVDGSDVGDNIVLEKKESHINKEKNKSSVFIAVIITLFVCLVAFGLFYKYYLQNLVVETTRLVKDVTVTDKGIADAVEKIYDATVIIKNYRNNNLYATGTGVVYNKDDNYGYILTNYHVIQNATSVKVVMTNDKVVDAEIINGDQYADIALLKISKDEVISIAEIGNSNNMRLGDTTFVVGAPIDSDVYSWTVTRGILSGTNRVVEVNTNTDSFVMEVLQTDAAINSGNSGGPLCNSNGEVVGIVNMKLASSNIEGMGFAIPIETAIKYADSYINNKPIARPYLGISYSQNYFFSQTGLYISGVEENSPASKAGLQSGDRITKINGVEIKSASYFKYELYKYNPGDKIKVTYERNKKEETVTVTLGTFENET